MIMPDTPPTGGPTKDEILAISLMKLQVKPEDIFADIGCGTGKVTVHVSPQVSHIYAIDSREHAYQWTKAEVERHQLKNVTMHHADAKTVLSSLDHLDTAFVGGSRGLEGIIEELARLRVRGVVINAVLLGTVHTAVQLLQRYEMFHEVIQVQVSKSVPLAGGIMLKPIDPVFIIHGGVVSC